MKHVAIIFTQLPHGNAKGREALDAALALSIHNHISLFFIGDGIYHLLPQQQTDKILARNYIATFGVLDLYEIEDCFVCDEDMQAQGINLSGEVTKVNIVSREEFKQKLSQQDTTLFF